MTTAATALLIANRHDVRDSVRDVYGPRYEAVIAPYRAGITQLMRAGRVDAIAAAAAFSRSLQCHAGSFGLLLVQAACADVLDTPQTIRS